MSRFLLVIQNPKVLGWIVLIVAVFCVRYTQGLAQFIGLIALASAAFVVYALWYYRWRARGRPVK